MRKPVNVVFIGENFPDGGDRKMHIVQQTIQMLADGNDEVGLRSMPEMYDYEIQILNLPTMKIDKGYGEDRNIVRISFDFSIDDPTEFYKHVSHMLHVYMFDLQANDFGAFAKSEYSWVLKNALNAYNYMIKEDSENV